MINFGLYWNHTLHKLNSDLSGMSESLIVQKIDS
jgi:hypothetical protein